MIETRLRMLIALTLFVATAAGAAEHSDLYIVPIAGHAQGAHGTSWRSDLTLHNFQGVPVDVEIALIESGHAPSDAPATLASFTLLPGETRTLADVAGHLGRDAAGALLAGASLPFVMTSRTWAELPGGSRTLGQSVLPIGMAGAADAVNETAVLPSLTAGTRQRANVGLFVAASHAPLVVEVALLSPAGALIGSQMVILDEPGFIHRQFPVASSASPTAVVRILEGDGIVVPYASVIDNASAEALFVPADPIVRGGALTRSMLAGIVTGEDWSR